MAPSTSWQQATVVGILRETRSAKTLRLKLAAPSSHKAGQHYVLRLTAPDGYRAQRSYSVASAPGGDTIDLTVELLPDGEVSGYLHQVVEVGDELEVRGPIGEFFAWDGTHPMLGIAGGSGVVPLMSMLRHARAQGTPDLVRLVVSTRRSAELYYPGELAGAQTTVVYTREAPGSSKRPASRLNSADLAAVLVVDTMDVYVCGTTGFCDSVTKLLRELGVEPGHIRVERFGPTG
jgi:ferredoxin-NADP reductase